MCSVSSTVLVLFLEREVSCKNVIHNIVKVGAINQPLSLVAWVHGSPAELVIRHLPLHEAPNRATHHSHWLLPGQDQKLPNLIKRDSLTEKRGCEQRVYSYKAAISEAI